MQADDFLIILFATGCVIQPKQVEKEEFKFTEDEVELLAKEEHNRFVENKIKAGWLYGDIRDDEEKHIR